MNSETQGPWLVTGAAGFIGARFVQSCNQRGIPVISVDRETFFTERPEHKGIDYGTIVNLEALQEKLGQDVRPTAIIHLGACADTMETDLEYLDRLNVKYSQFLWEYASQHQIPFIYASSAATYGDGALGYDDNESIFSGLRPLNPYGQSKQTFDLWALEQEKRGQKPPRWAGFKFFNVYGYGERHKGRMASVILHSFEQIQKEGKIRLFQSHRAGISDGHQKRDFIHVDDVVDVLHFTLEQSPRQPLSRGIYNLGTGQARTFLDLARAVFQALGKTENIEFIPTPEEIRDRYQYFTEAKMERLRGQGYTRLFRSLEEGVALYVHQLQQGL